MTRITQIATRLGLDPTDPILKQITQNQSAAQIDTFCLPEAPKTVDLPTCLQEGTFDAEQADVTIAEKQQFVTGLLDMARSLEESHMTFILGDLRGIALRQLNDTVAGLKATHATCEAVEIYQTSGDDSKLLALFSLPGHPTRTADEIVEQMPELESLRAEVQNAVVSQTQMIHELFPELKKDLGFDASADAETILSAYHENQRKPSIAQSLVAYADTVTKELVAAHAARAKLEGPTGTTVRAVRREQLAEQLELVRSDIAVLTNERDFLAKTGVAAWSRASGKAVSFIDVISNAEQGSQANLKVGRIDARITILHKQARALEAIIRANKEPENNV